MKGLSYLYQYLKLEYWPADKAGMKPGNVLTQVNGQAASDVIAFLNRIALTSPGDEIKINLPRKGKSMTLNIQVGKQMKLKEKTCSQIKHYF